MVYYRKYRPQNFDELLGQLQVKQVLSKASSSNNLSHAYLFCGPRGTGKTSTARILAKIINCESENPPCNTCESCLSITDGSNLDLIEIDAASNRGIDDIRSLRENIKLSPTKSKKKVYIIDEVHMLTTEAFNALLKTLEEPPAHVIFIMATTEAHKVPQTILSRVQKLDFQLASLEDLVKALEKIVVSEKLEADKEALELIARKGQGSFRDTQKLLDQVASAGEKITVELVESILKSGNSEDIYQFILSLSEKNSQKALEILKTQVDLGVNLKEFNLSVLDYLRTLLLAKYSPSADTKISELAAKIDEKTLLKITSCFVSGLEKMKYVSIPSFPLEIAVIESCMSLEGRVQNSELSEKQQTNGLSNELAGKMQNQINQLEAKLKQLEVSKSVILEGAQRPMSTAPADAVESNRSYNEVGTSFIATTSSSLQDDNNPKENVVPIVLDTDAAQPISSDEVNKLLDKWNYILETIKPYNFSLEALLKQAKVLSVSDGLVVLEVPYSFHQRILEAPKSRDLLESVLADVLGKSAKVTCVLGKRPVRVEEIANIELAADDEVIKLAAEIFNS